MAVIDKTACKGCGGCVPVCPINAIDLQGYTDAQIRAMIDGLLEECDATMHDAVQPRDVREIIRDEHLMRRRILTALETGPLTIPEIAEAVERPTHEVMFWVMGMRKYGYVGRDQRSQRRRLLPLPSRGEGGRMSTLVNPGLATELERSDEFNASACMNCGVCTAVCPMGIEVLPRRLFRYVMLGMEDQVLDETETRLSPACSARCARSTARPGVHIAENVRSLRHHINRTVFGL